MTPITFTVAGEPEPQGSARGFCFPLTDRAGRVLIDPRTRLPRMHVAITHDNPKVTAWRAAIQAAALRACGGQAPEWIGGVSVNLKFFVVPPQKIPRSRCGLPIVRDDVDKLARAVLDAITGTIVRDDSQVVTLVASKRYADTPADARVDITVTPIAIGLPLVPDERTVAHGRSDTRHAARARRAVAVPW